MTIVEKILASHAQKKRVIPGDIVDILIDIRVARDFGGANVVKIIENNNLRIDDPSRTYFTFDCNPAGSDQKYAENQQICRVFARKHGVTVYDIDKGIGTHLLIEEGLAIPGSTVVSTDSHANLLGAVGSFGQGMGDKDIASVWSTGKTWFKVPETIKLYLKGRISSRITAKDIILNLLAEFGPDRMLGYAIEIYGDEIDSLTMDKRITISSMATELGAIIITFPPGNEVKNYFKSTTGIDIPYISADKDASYSEIINLDMSKFKPLVSLPGKPHHAVSVDSLPEIKIDSAFIGSCTNGRMEDMRTAADILKSRKVAPGTVLKIVPATDLIWRQCLEEGIMEIFKNAGALVSNAGCAGCAAGQVGQNGPGEITISTGNRNFPGKQGQGEVYLASPEIVAASAVAGFITTPDKIPSRPRLFKTIGKDLNNKPDIIAKKQRPSKPEIIKGRARIINIDDIDTDMIFHNRYLTLTENAEMGQYTFDNLPGYEDFAKKTINGDILVTGKNFGSGSSRQQAVDCFISLGIQCIVAKSFGAIYERNAINAGLPVISSRNIHKLDLEEGHEIQIDLLKGVITNLSNNKSIEFTGFTKLQMDIYKNNGIF